jgi:hypothetical protein
MLRLCSLFTSLSFNIVYIVIVCLNLCVDSVNELVCVLFKCVNILFAIKHIFAHFHTTPVTLTQCILRAKGVRSWLRPSPAHFVFFIYFIIYKITSWIQFLSHRPIKILKYFHKAGKTKWAHKLIDLGL